MGFNGSFNNGEAKSGSFDLSLGVVFFNAVKAFENEGEIGARDSDSVVRDADGKVALLVFLGVDSDLQGDCGILFEGILNKIEENLGPVEMISGDLDFRDDQFDTCLLYTSPSPRDRG